MKTADDLVTRDERDDWRAVLTALVAAHPKGKQGVADLMGVSRVFVSRVFMAGPNRIEHPGKAFVAKVWGAVGAVDCPHLGRTLTTAACTAHATRSWGALTGQAEVQHWRACQRCPHNPASAMAMAHSNPQGNATSDTPQEASHA